MAEPEARRAIESMCTATSTIVFSSTPSDLLEPSHLTVRPVAFWLRVFSDHGFRPVPSYDASFIAPHSVVVQRSTDTRDDELIAITGEIARLRTGLASKGALEHEIEGLRVEIRRLIEAAAMQNAAHSVRLAEQRAALHADIDSAVAARDDAVRAREQVYASTSWRVTRPMRGVMRLARGERALKRPTAPAQGERSFDTFRDGVHRLSTVETLKTVRLDQLRPVAVLPSPNAEPTLNVLTDSIGPRSLFGGVGTALILGTLLAGRLGFRLRIVTRNDTPSASAFDSVLSAAGLLPCTDVEFLQEGGEIGKRRSIPLGSSDLILTTSWWTTWSTLQSIPPEQIVYLLQEDERQFYPAGDEELLCREILREQRIRFVVNSRMLRDYLAVDEMTGVAKNSISFEPAFPSKLFFREQRPSALPRRLLFYARPNHPRNLFLRGLEVLDAAIESNILDPDSWDIHFVGRDIPNVELAASVRPIGHEQLTWLEYASLVRSADLGLSLMYSPHTSYPPLDLAASGAVVVTNTYGPKTSLSDLSQNIICKEPSVESLLGGMREGVLLAMDDVSRERNYEHSTISAIGIGHSPQSLIGLPPNVPPRRAVPRVPSPVGSTPCPTSDRPRVGISTCRLLSRSPEPKQLSLSNLQHDPSLACRSARCGRRLVRDC